MPDQDSLDVLTTFVKELKVDSLSLSFSAKKTIKVGDDYRSFEAHETWTFSHPSGNPITPAQAQHASSYYSPHLIRKLFFALHVAGVISAEELSIHFNEITRLYSKLTTPRTDEQRTDSSDLSRAGESVSSDTPQQPAGTELPQGQDGGLPVRPGPSEQYPT